MYQTQISIHSVISISLTQNISDIKLVRGCCQDIARKLIPTESLLAIGESIINYFRENNLSTMITCPGCCLLLSCSDSESELSVSMVAGRNPQAFKFQQIKGFIFNFTQNRGNYEINSSPFKCKQNIQTFFLITFQTLIET